MEFTATVTRITPVNVRGKVIDAGCSVKKGVLAEGIAGVTSMKNGPCITVSQDLSEEWQRVTIAAIVAEILDAGEMLHVIAEGGMDDPPRTTERARSLLMPEEDFKAAYTALYNAQPIRPALLAKGFKVPLGEVMLRIRDLFPEDI